MFMCMFMYMHLNVQAVLAQSLHLFSSSKVVAALGTAPGA
jgi:hypothetical protein